MFLSASQDGGRIGQDKTYLHVTHPVFNLGALARLRWSGVGCFIFRRLPTLAGGCVRAKLWCQGAGVI